MGLFALSPRRAAMLRRIRRRAWVLIGLGMIWQVLALPRHDPGPVWPPHDPITHENSGN